MREPRSFKGITAGQPPESQRNFAPGIPPLPDGAPRSGAVWACRRREFFQELSESWRRKKFPLFPYWRFFRRNGVRGFRWGFRMRSTVIPIR